ncbi:GNAT family N-acetyltransferase [Starkeya koreensis]|uniref:GNAT family N-acetyltransferase n=1 Tax=Ancylobacter koreensis TaxID=266121 RepID=A0ABT0DJQ3_9HYPH|nr:GNAT family N-acetyltransferase [Ancylobacter koreensis]MCK0207409.1 GNAT family N-acetyltransferase [Ancylobacter koreensis]
MSLLIRPVEREDLPAVATLLARLADHVQPGKVPRAGVAELERYGPAGLGLFEALVAWRGEAAVGLCLYTYTFSGWRGRPGLRVEDLYVEPSERGGGLGRALLAAALGREADKGCAYVKLAVDRSNESGLGFYRRLGFTLEEHDHEMLIEGAALAALLDP